MHHVTARDGTPIAYEREGTGPAVVLVGGAIDDGTENAPLVPELADNFTVYNYARRGRGESGDTPPYAVLREIEDLEAIIVEAGGSAHVYGVSSGGALALEAAAAGLPINRLAVYEVPYNIKDDWPHWNRHDAMKAEKLLAGGRPDDVIELFMRTVGSSEEDIAGAKSSPFWRALEALAHTLPYDGACVGEGPPPADRLATITQPTLVLTGSPSNGPGGLPAGFMDEAAKAIVASIPEASRQTLEGQGHVADPSVVAKILARFLDG